MTNVAPFRRLADGQPDIAAGRAGGMAVIAVAARAAGVGKTMLAAHIAVQAEFAGDGPVAILDLDPRGTLMEWWNRRQAKIGAPVLAARSSAATIAPELDGLRGRGIKLCVIDTPPGGADTAAPALEAAHMVVVPCDADSQSVNDAIALGGRIGGRATVAFVINGRSHAGEKQGNPLGAIGMGGGWPAGMVRHADAFAIAMTAGRTVMESHASGEAAADVTELWINLRGILVAG